MVSWEKFIFRLKYRNTGSANVGINVSKSIETCRCNISCHRIYFCEVLNFVFSGSNCPLKILANLFAPAKFGWSTQLLPTHSPPPLSSSLIGNNFMILQVCGQVHALYFQRQTRKYFLRGLEPTIHRSFSNLFSYSTFAVLTASLQIKMADTYCLTYVWWVRE